MGVTCDAGVSDKRQEGELGKFKFLICCVCCVSMKLGVSERRGKKKNMLGFV